jgi:hypothetical protein
VSVAAARYHRYARHPVRDRILDWLIARAMGIRLGDGTAIEAIRLGDGTAIEEVRKGDGTVVWPPADGLPASATHRYDASELNLSDTNTVSTWADEIGTSDLSAVGDPTYRTNILNSNPVVRSDGSGDAFNNLGVLMEQPYTFLIVVSQNSAANGQIMDSDTSANRLEFAYSTNIDWYIDASNVSGGANDGSHYLFAGVYDGATSVLRQDGTQIASVSVGCAHLDDRRLEAGVADLLGAGVWHVLTGV